MTKEEEIALAYAKNFWASGDSIVVLMFGLAFSVYFVISQFPLVRYWVSIYFYWLLSLAIVGNLGLAIVLYRLSTHELRIVKIITANSCLLDAIESAFHIRIALFIFNFLLYVAVLFFVHLKVDTSIRPSNDSSSSG